VGLSTEKRGLLGSNRLEAVSAQSGCDWRARWSTQDRRHRERLDIRCVHKTQSNARRQPAVFPYTKEKALLAGKLDGEQQGRGVVIPFTDLLIGATALVLSYSVLTVNARHFERIPGLSVVRL